MLQIVRMLHRRRPVPIVGAGVVSWTGGHLEGS